MTLDELQNRFMHHAPTAKGKEAERYPIIRQECLEVAIVVTNLCPESRETDLAISKLEEAMFWANAAIARNPGVDPRDNSQ